MIGASRAQNDGGAFWNSGRADFNSLGRGV